MNKTHQPMGLKLNQIVKILQLKSLGRKTASKLSDFAMNVFYYQSKNFWTICCIPASTEERTHIPYCNLIDKLSRSSNVSNGYDFVSVIEDHEIGHKGIKPIDIIPYLDLKNLKIIEKKLS